MHPSAPQNRRTVWGDNELASREANCLLNWPNSLWEPRPEWLSLQGRGTGSPGSQSLAPTMVPQEGFRKCFQPQQLVRTGRSAVPTARSWSRSPLTPPPPPPLSHVACEPLTWPCWAARDAWQGREAIGGGRRCRRGCSRRPPGGAIDTGQLGVEGHRGAVHCGREGQGVASLVQEL